MARRAARDSEGRTTATVACRSRDLPVAFLECKNAREKVGEEERVELGRWLHKRDWDRCSTRLGRSSEGRRAGTSRKEGEAFKIGPWRPRGVWLGLERRS